jgi:hypothetical protein
VPGQLAIAAIELALVVDGKRGADHRRLQIVRHDRLDDAAELVERLDVQLQPSLDALVERHPHDHVSAVCQHHHEAPRFAKRHRGRVEQLADVAEVHLRDLSRRCLDWDRHVLRSHTLRSLNGATQAFHRRMRAGELRMLQAQSVEDGSRSEPLERQRDDDRPVVLERALLLGSWPGRPGAFDGGLQLLQCGQCLRRPVQQARPSERFAVLPLGVRSHPQETRSLPRSRLVPMKPNQLLQPVHLSPPVSHPRFLLP